MPNWFCELCNNSACKLLSNLAELNNRMENMEKRIDDLLQGKVREMEQKTGDLKKEVINVNGRIDNFEKNTEFWSVRNERPEICYEKTKWQSGTEPV